MPLTRISNSDHQILLDLSKKTGMSHQQIIHNALDTYQRDRLLDSINESFARLKANKSAWKEMTTERKQLEKSSDDGVKD